MGWGAVMREVSAGRYEGGGMGRCVQEVGATWVDSRKGETVQGELRAGHTGHRPIPWIIPNGSLITKKAPKP